MINNTLIENAGLWLVDLEQTRLLKKYSLLIGWFSLSKQQRPSTLIFFYVKCSRSKVCTTVVICFIHFLSVFKFSVSLLLNCLGPSKSPICSRALSLLIEKLPVKGKKGNQKCCLFWFCDVTHIKWNVSNKFKFCGISKYLNFNF